MTSHTTASGETTQPTDLDRAVDDLLEDARQLRAAALRFEESPDDTDRRYADELAQVLSILDVDLTLARATFAAARAHDEGTADTSVITATAAVRGWLQEARVQARLAGMEARDRNADLVGRLDHVGVEARRGAERIGEVVENDTDEIRLMAGRSVNLVSEIFAEAVDAFRGRRS